MTDPESPAEHTVAITRTAPGAAGTQTVSADTEGVVVGTVRPDTDHVGALLQARADARGTLDTQLAAAVYSDLSEAKKRLEERLDQATAKIDTLKEQLGAAQTTIAVLKGKLEQRRLKTLLFGVGGVCLGTGLSGVVQPGDGRIPIVGILLLLVGAVLMYLGLPDLGQQD